MFLLFFRFQRSRGILDALFRHNRLRIWRPFLLQSGHLSLLSLPVLDLCVCVFVLRSQSRGLNHELSLCCLFVVDLFVFVGSHLSLSLSCGSLCELFLFGSHLSLLSLCCVFCFGSLSRLLSAKAKQEQKPRGHGFESHSWQVHLLQHAQPESLNLLFFFLFIPQRDPVRKEVQVSTTLWRRSANCRRQEPRGALAQVSPSLPRAGLSRNDKDASPTARDRACPPGGHASLRPSAHHLMS